MNPTLRLATALPALVLLAACAGPSSPPAPSAAPAVAPQPAPAAVPDNPLRPVYRVALDLQGIAHGPDGRVVNRESVIDLLTNDAIDRLTVVHIEVPKAAATHEQSLAAFARAQQVAKIFNLLGFQSVQIGLTP